MSDLDVFPVAFHAELKSFPPALLELLAAELRAGNELVSVGGGFPAPPIGACAVLKRAITTRDRASCDGVLHRRWPNWTLTSGFHDERGHFFVMEPDAPEEPRPVPVVDVTPPPTRSPSTIPTATRPSSGPEAPPMPPRTDTLVDRFVRSMQIDYGKWRDGEGYDLDLIRVATPEERDAIERLLLGRGIRDWRDAEALAALGTPRAHAAILDVMRSSDRTLRMEVTRFALELLDDAERTKSLVDALTSVRVFEGLTQALDEAVQFHPPAVIDALFRGALDRDGGSAYHFAATLAHLLGHESTRLGLDDRLFFLRFNTDDRAARIAVFRELCERLGVDATRYLAP